MSSIASTRSISHTSRELHEGWSVQAASGPAPDAITGQAIVATVPGVVHMDLLAANLIPDPYLDNNEALLAWIGLVDWTYQTTFAMTDAELSAERHDLVFDGLDTVATVTLNGTVLAEVANQHRTYRFDVTELVLTGENTLIVAFRSPVRYANAQSLELGTRPRPYPLPFDAIRKSACSFGWDWGIATATSGIWRPVRLESWSTARLAAVRINAQPRGDGGRVDATVQVEGTSDDALTLELTVAGVAASVSVPAGEKETTVSVDIDQVDRWWPAGFGEQPLYDAVVTLSGSDGELDSVARRVGFRTLVWDTTPDETGSTPFQLVVNGQPVFVKGVNWIPDDALFPRVDRARYERRLRQAKAANLNLIRVWGGGMYESDDFYDLCDELGLLTWQDFLFACAAYSEDEPLRGEIEAEARDNVVRIAHHSSLALFTGNNENIWGFEDWGWQEVLDGKSWGHYYYYDLFPTLIDELAPQVAYAPGSPFSPGGEHPNDVRHGTMHLWEQWNRQGYETYRDQIPRFVAEFGWQGPPAWSTLVRSISDDPLTPESPGMIVHQKAGEGNAKLAAGLVPHYRIPEHMETWHWAMQLNQANAVGLALDWFRSNSPFTSGAVVWQLNDCWPVTSWAAIDGDEVEKPLLFAIKNAFAPRVITIQPREEWIVATIVNDSPDDWAGDLVFTRRRFDGEVLATTSVPTSLGARSTQAIAVPDDIARASDAATEVVSAELNGVRGLWFFAEPRDSALAPAELDIAVAPDDGGTTVTVTSRNLVRDLTLLVDKINPKATVDEGLVTLLPGESFTFHVTGIDGVDVSAASAAEVTRSGNQLVVS